MPHNFGVEFVCGVRRAFGNNQSILLRKTVCVCVYALSHCMRAISINRDQAVYYQSPSGRSQAAVIAFGPKICCYRGRSIWRAESVRRTRDGHRATSQSNAHKVLGKSEQNGCNANGKGGRATRLSLALLVVVLRSNCDKFICDGEKLGECQLAINRHFYFSPALAPWRYHRWALHCTTSQRKESALAATGTERTAKHPNGIANTLYTRKSQHMRVCCVCVAVRSVALRSNKTRLSQWRRSTLIS